MDEPPFPDILKAPHSHDRKVIVIGASAGGVQALQRVASGFKANLDAPVLAVLHIGNHHSVLPALLSAKGPLQAKHPADGELMAPGLIYISPPDRHMIIDQNVIRLNRGAKEHHTRPAIDPLFRSAALSFGPGAIGVVLTGRLDDGTAGLQAIKSCGGIAIVQDPADAQEPSMPLSALRYVQVDHCVILDQIAEVCAAAVRKPLASTPAASQSPSLAYEHDIALARGNPVDHLRMLGQPSTFVCPDCRGSLWEIAQSQPPRYRCHTGHAYSLRTLLHAQYTATDEALWTALRALQERAFLLEKLAHTGDSNELIFADGAREMHRQAAMVRSLIEGSEAAGAELTS